MDSIKEVMDERVKFRAWDNIGKCMLDWGAICQTAYNRSEENGYGLMYRILTNQAAAGENYGFVIMQYTGLKDKKGNEIYAGDIIHFADQYYYEVRFEDGKFVGYHANRDWGKWGDLCRLNDYGIKEYHFEVIGNIFDNPVLLTTVK